MYQNFLMIELIFVTMTNMQLTSLYAQDLIFLIIFQKSSLHLSTWI